MRPSPALDVRRYAMLLLLSLPLAGCEEAEPTTPPTQISESPFHYPEELWDAGVEGETILRVFVTPEGLVDTVQVEHGSGYEPFDSAAVHGARDLRFEPAMQGEEAVSVWVLLPVRFDLPGSAAADTVRTADTAAANRPD
jgi:periplasmic protein TonB